MEFEEEFKGVSSRILRRAFFSAMRDGIRVLWPIFSGLLIFIAGLGVLIGRLEGWSILDSLYFAFVTGLTIGYGDFSPHFASTRLLAVLIGLLGVLLTGLVAALGVSSLNFVRDSLASRAKR
ncbi:potassium channel family protein [Uliginosibacterium sp. H3]|uniref:Potassium channel family protein n=1 Tax=Uliginosibacterium silvisoli TaxID=3114758 RepID=A0ABU6JX86_9RHOO|nr:potassium channel family protein [Uliginosibacterium sp. H3]